MLNGGPSGKVRVHVERRRSNPAVYQITEERFAAARRRHPHLGDCVELSVGDDLETFDEAMRTAEILIGFKIPTKNLAERAPHLRWIHITGAGIEHLLPLEWTPPSVLLTTSSGVHAEMAGEYAKMALLMLNNRIPYFVTCKAQKRWSRVFSTAVAGKTLAVFGVGALGSAAAQRAKQLGLRVIGIRRTPEPHRDFDEMFGPGQLDQVLPRSDLILVAMPLTSETRGMIGRREFDLMKPGAGIVNMGRADIVDYCALADKLRSGEISGAILDVFAPEPLPAESELWDVPNLIMTPHVSSDDDEQYIPNILDLFFTNLGRLLAGEPLVNQVDPLRGY